MRAADDVAGDMGTGVPLRALLDDPARNKPGL